MNLLALVPSLATILSAVVTITGVVALLRHKQETFQKDLAREGEDLNKIRAQVDKYNNEVRAQVEKLNSDLSSAITMIKLVSQEQSLINKMSAGTLSSITDKFTLLEKIVMEHTTALAIIKERHERES